MNTLEKFLLDNSISEPEAKAAQLEEYMNGVLEWNEKVNLTAITDRDEFVQKHIIDSLLCAQAPEVTESSSICDIGTGGGFPGVPLAVCYPDKEFILMDSLAKRIRIVNDLCAAVGADNVTAVHGRAEELARQKTYRDRFDLCISRAVANMSTLCEYCLPFVRVGGTFIAYKGPNCESEINDAKRAIELLGGEVDRVEHPQFEIRGERFDHTLVYIIKKRGTPKAYPRKAGTPARNPL